MLVLGLSIGSIMTVDEGINEYEALRLAKIARNEARLRSLGLLQQSPPPRGQKSKARAQPNVSLPEEKPGSLLPLRRSKRTRKTINNSDNDHGNERAVNDARRREFGDEDDQDYEPPTEDPELSDDEKFTKVAKSDRATRKSIHRRQPSIPSKAVESRMSPHSARALHLDVAKLLFAEDLLGKTLTKTGKAHVMEESARLAVPNSNDDHDGQRNPISFNKYSGVQEWGNNVLFLWINLGLPNSDVTNDFLQNGRQVTWFGGSRMHEETPVIQRLLTIGKMVQPHGGGVVLWCRRYIKERKTFEPYTCLGRLSYVSHDPMSRPLVFIWKLDDYDHISNHSDETRLEKFQSIVHGHHQQGAWPEKLPPRS